MDLDTTVESPESFTTRDLALELGVTPKRIRRTLRALDIRCGSGARHAWNGAEYQAIRKRVRERLRPPPAPEGLNTTEEIVADFAAGKFVVLMDDASRENEGDLLMPAEKVTPEAINFMARYGRGLICMPMTRERCAQLGLKPMVAENREAHRTQFTTSIDAAAGVSTGISAADRATTVLAAVRPDAKPSDLVQPGHVFPLMSEPGGVLTRAGHTEAGCDLARLAGLEPAAVLVEILNEDGTMARRPELEAFARGHGLKLGTIADLIRHRMTTEKTVRRVGECDLPTRHGHFRLVAYQDTMEERVHLALVTGDPGGEDADAALIRVHVSDSLNDLTGSRRDAHLWSIGGALERIAREGAGALIILRSHETEQDVLARVHAYEQQDRGADLPSIERGHDLRTYGLGTQILLDLGLTRVRVLGTPRRLLGVSGFGLRIVDYVET